MNRKNIEKAVFPSFEEGWPRRFKNGSLPHVIGAAGEVRLSFQQVLDLPRCALSKVARHFVSRAQRPLLKGLKGGERAFFHLFSNPFTPSPGEGPCPFTYVFIYKYTLTRSPEF